MRSKFWSRVWVDEWADDSPGGCAIEVDNQWGSPFKNKIELTPADKATLQTSGSLMLDGHYLLISSDIDPTVEEKEDE